MTPYNDYSDVEDEPSVDNESYTSIDDDAILLSHIIEPLDIINIYTTQFKPIKGRRVCCSDVIKPLRITVLINNMYIESLSYEYDDGWEIGELSDTIFKANPGISFIDFIKKINITFNEKLCRIVDDSYKNITDEYINKTIDDYLTYKKNVRVYDEYVRRALPRHREGEPFTELEMRELNGGLRIYDITLDDLKEYQDLHDIDGSSVNKDR